MTKKNKYKIAAVLFVFCTLTRGEAQTLTLDAAIVENMKHISNVLTAETKVAIMIESESKKLSDYIVGESGVFIMNYTKLSLVDKSKLPNILKNKNINGSNEINEELALEIGRELGASSVIFGSISKVGANYRFRIQSVDAADGQIQVMQSLNVKPDETLADLSDSRGRDMSDRNSINSQSTNNSNPNVQVVIVKDTPAETAKVQESPPAKENTTKVFLGNRWQNFVYKSGDIGWGWEFEIGKYREMILVTSVTSFNVSSNSSKNPDMPGNQDDFGGDYPDPYNNNSSGGSGGSGGGGSGVFIAPIISAGDYFKIVPGMDIGFWFYRYADKDMGSVNHLIFGGPDVRMMLGYQFIFLDVLARAHFGPSVADSELGTSERKFRAKFSFGVGVSFLLGGGN